MLICVCALPSCEELGLDELFQTESSSLSGTQWQHIEYNTPAGTVHSTLSFSSSTFSLSIKQSKGTNQSYSGKYEYWVAVVKPGRVLFELADVDEATAREALRLAMHKLPIKCKFVVREDSVKEDGTNEG